MIGNNPFAEIQAISYSVTREKAPIYTLGSPEPRAFSRNKRGIAGSLIGINFDRHALLRYAGPSAEGVSNQVPRAPRRLGRLRPSTAGRSAVISGPSAS